MNFKVVSNPNHYMIQQPKSVHPDLVRNYSVSSTQMQLQISDHDEHYSKTKYFCISLECFFITSEKNRLKLPSIL